MIPGRSNPCHIVNLNNLYARPGLHRETGDKSFLCLIEHSQNAFSHAGLQRRIEELAGPANRCGKALVVHRLQKVVQRVHPECAQRVLFRRSQKDYVGELLFRHRAQNL